MSTLEAPLLVYLLFHLSGYILIASNSVTIVTSNNEPVSYPYHGRPGQILISLRSLSSAFLDCSIVAHMSEIFIISIADQDNQFEVKISDADTFKFQMFEFDCDLVCYFTCLAGHQHFNLFTRRTVPS